MNSAHAKRRLPSLGALQAFEAAARHLSFTLAARELHVTPGAISHQVRALEAELEEALFLRGHRSLTLTRAGQGLGEVARRSFDSLAEAVRALAVERRHQLTVSVSPSFANKWLLARLPRFRERHPQIELRILATQALADFTRDGVDIAVRYGLGRYAGLVSTRLFGEVAFPVASPKLLKRVRLKSTVDLASHTLLHDEVGQAHGGWPEWLAAAKVRHVDASLGTRYSDATLLFQDALEGRGVALVRSVLAIDDLAAGRLVRPFELSIPVRHHHALVCPKRALQRPEVRAFREFLLEEARACEFEGRPLRAR
ncbi:MAG: transcriptional regulator GcvA [Deltaproteobacteria bacterium]|nr:transcriptional regulator GcvA [Deltaproteobacteria bacterium]